MNWLPITDSFYSSWCPRVLTWEMEGMADPERWRGERRNFWRGASKSNLKSEGLSFET
jgi:hypothetical protein